MSTSDQNPPAPTTPGRVPCPGCGAEVAPDEAFCEACGQTLTPTVQAQRPDDIGTEMPIELSAPVTEAATAWMAPPEPMRAPCRECGGVVDDDLYCQTCGTKAPSKRDHFSEAPADWVAGVSDLGRRHHRNEDALALAAQGEPGERAVLVVCDGVSSSLDSDVASLAAVRKARDVLAAHRPAGLGLRESRTSALVAAMVTATAAANAAVVATTTEDGPNTASCTFAAAVVTDHLVVYGNVGDSRVYWLPDAGEASELSVDDSVAQERIAAGIPREDAENGPQAHAITRWLGRDSEDHEPRTGSVQVTEPGWLLVCSDGLWNYASEASVLQELVAELITADEDRREPLPLSDALVDWANEQGGRDNISVALARLDPPADNGSTRPTH
ncbi:MAG: protein phosphatase 2C domain-containing protein [Propionibacteriaceae bacterium]